MLPSPKEELTFLSQTDASYLNIDSFCKHNFTELVFALKQFLCLGAFHWIRLQSWFESRALRPIYVVEIDTRYVIGLSKEL